MRNRQQKRVFYLISLSTDLILGESELASKLGLCHFSKFIAYQISQKKTKLASDFSENIFTDGWTDGKKKYIPQPAFTCSKLTIETLEQGVKYVQS